MAIHYLTYQQVDKIKWDTCITSADNGLIYAYTDYLDCMAKNWDALVLTAGPDSDAGYEAVMPLTWNKKHGIHYLYQPAFTACLGVFGKNLSAGIVNDFLKSIPAKFKYWDISLNHGNHFACKDFNLYERMNFVLNMNKPYEDLFRTYRNNIKRNIKKSEELQLAIVKNIAVADIIQLAKDQATHFSSMDEYDFLNFEKLYQRFYNNNKATTYAVYSKQKQLIASAVFFFSNKRAYYIMVGNSPDGKTLGASHALINAFIKDHAGDDLLLDFEGSDISSLAFFYSSFGATSEKYSAIKLNRLPALIKWLKK